MQLISGHSSPHRHNVNATSRVMGWVMLALLPGLVAQTVYFGWGSLINVLWASLVAVSCEAVVMKLRKRPIAFYIKDGSALVTGALIGLAIPPFAPFWVTLVATAFAIIIGKHLYGGLGQNPFNPAMLGYVIVLISFPQEMTRWLAPLGLVGYNGSFTDALAHIFLYGNHVDGATMATVLDTVKENRLLTMEQLWGTNPMFFGWFGVGVLWVNAAYLVGGLVLMWRKVITWHAPLGMLLALGLMALLFWNGSGVESNGSPLFHLFSGATMLGAFFIITDPVSGATSNAGRFVFGVGVGILLYVIRIWGGFPDAVAFATLLMNMVAPTIDYYTQPRTYGYKRPVRGMFEKD